MPIENVAPPLQLWKSYKYLGGDRGHTYHEVRHEPTGGPENGPYVWADDTKWSIDTPEDPPSILFLIQYRIWNNEPPLDLRNAELRFRLRGENLALHGGRCHFWAVTYAPTATRWHYSGESIPIADGCWGDEVVLRLEDDPEKWHHSFSSFRGGEQTLGATLSTCFSYGFSLVGFSEKVTGRICLADFRLHQEVDPCWPYVYNSSKGGSEWLTVSRECGAQVFIAAPERLAGGQSVLVGNGGPGLYLRQDYLSLGSPFAFVYLAMVRAQDSTGGRDLRNALVNVRQVSEGFDAKGGKICFFVEHAASGTRWVLKVPIENCSNQPWSAMLSADEVFWGRLSGTLPLEDVLAGENGRAGYDYFGLMLTGPQGEPSGIWGMTLFSVGPTLDRRCLRTAG